MQFLISEKYLPNMAKLVYILFSAFVILVGVFLRHSYKSNKIQTIPTPLPIFKLTSFLSRFFHNIADAMLPPSIVVLNDHFGNFKSQVIYVSCRLDLAHHLAGGPKLTEELASLNNIPKTDNILRLLRAAESFGYFRQDLRTGLWYNTHLSEILDSNHPSSLAHLIKFSNEDMNTSWNHLFEGIVGNEDIFKLTHDGKSAWEYFEENPIQHEQFSLGMSNFDSLVWYAITHDHDWSGYSRVIDIGGGYGVLLSKILKVYPKLAGLLFEIPTVIEKAKSIWKEKHSDLSERISMKSGTFFDVNTLPAIEDNDALLLKNTLHDWSDADALEILKNLRKAIGTKKATLVIVESSLEPHDYDYKRFLLDLNMLLISGKERYKDQWKNLFDVAGFELVIIKPTRSMDSIIIAKPV